MSVQRHDELACITSASAMWSALLAYAAERDDVGLYDRIDGEIELREALPGLLDQLSPNARAVLADHLSHVCELVAHIHWKSEVSGQEH